ncbi:MAG: 2-C-methyl-D-erythritol 4-phosphate cytidylyltransferase [Erysipelotrichales bacterium]|nr:2-C-methyl-D-erythritol 4-phosphate cytidylyltransferase [Erysipelotrichales bacterium]
MNYLILLASGSGKRMNNTTPKQFLEILNKPLIYYSLTTFENNKNIDEVVIVTKRKYFKKMYQIIEEYSFDKVHLIVEGGKYRQESSYNALMALNGFAIKDDIVIIHDAARPLISNEDINNLILAMEKHTSASLGTKVVDTTIKVKNHKFLETIDRDDLISIQTPQAFKYGAILRAHKKALKEGIKSATDDAQLMCLLNKKYYIVEGNKQNFKITTESDLILLESILRRNNS